MESGESYAITYTAVADLEDGSYVLLQYLFSNAGWGDGKGLCRAMVVPVGQKGLNAAEKVSRDGWAYDPKTETLRVGDCRLQYQSGTTLFLVKADKLEVALSINAGFESIKPPNNHIKADDAFWEFEILIPSATFVGSVSTPSYSKENVKGHVYLDRTRSTALLPDVASRWVRFKGFYGKTPFMMQIRYKPDRSFGEAWMYSKDALLTKLPEGGFSITENSKQVGVALKGAPHFGDIQTTSLIHRYKPTAAYGVMGALAKPWVGDPTILTYRASFVGKDGVEVRGILEDSKIRDE